MRRPIVVGLAIGLAIGLAVPVLLLGVSESHVVCSVGPVIGSSGWISTPLDIALAPPGGSVNSSMAVGGSYRVAEGSSFPSNDTTVDTIALNWTLHSETSTTVLGWGTTSKCDGESLVAGTSIGGCGGCVVAPPTPAGIGQRLVVPSQLGNDFAVINGSYGSAPIASFNWSVSNGGVTWSNPLGLAGMPVELGPFFERGQLFGFKVELSLSGIEFGVPIHLAAGGLRVIAASFPASVPGMTYAASMTYVLPASTAQGTWAIFLAGSGSAYPLGGFLFEETAGPG